MKNIKVECCNWCPYYKYETIIGKYIMQCKKTFLEIIDGTIIPEWCPLEDVPILPFNIKDLSNELVINDGIDD